MLGTKDIVAFVPSRNPAKARAFYEGILGLRFVSEDPFALVLDANGVMIRVANVSSVDGFKPAAFTILGWLVDDIRAGAKGLKKKGVRFERYPSMEQDELGVWDSPSGAKIVWFKDPEGNVLSLTEK
jgi:catechol 2,3-dioxygenase-like lactoylglutathione lyase family enzyme